MTIGAPGAGLKKTRRAPEACKHDARRAERGTMVISHAPTTFVHPAPITDSLGPVPVAWTDVPDPADPAVAPPAPDPLEVASTPSVTATQDALWHHIFGD